MFIVAQGRKQVMFGTEVRAYDPASYLMVSVDLLISGQILEASPKVPYLCFQLSLDPVVLSALVVEFGLSGEASSDSAPGLWASSVTPELLDAATRLLRMVEHPRDIPVLAPLVEREILYRLLTGPEASRLRQIALADSTIHQVSRAIGWIKRHFREPFRMEAVASEAFMSPSTLHRHFKAVTAMSPLQYQKQLRLHEARRMMFGASMDAAAASRSVGYHSMSQFSREYRRLFGAPPALDIAQLRSSSRGEHVAGGARSQP